MADPNRLCQNNPQFRARGYFETTGHPVAGDMPLSSFPFRYASVEGSWYRTHSPLFGQHNEQVLGGILGLSADELADLESEGLIGTQPEGL